MNQIQQTHMQSPAPLIHAWEPVWRAYKLTSWMLTDLLQPTYREVKHEKKGCLSFQTIFTVMFVYYMHGWQGIVCLNCPLRINMVFLTLT